MTDALAMRSIFLPQALRITVPPMANCAVPLLKDASVASLIPASELMLRERGLRSEYFMSMELYLPVGAMYVVMAYPRENVRSTSRQMAGAGSQVKEAGNDRC